MLYNHWERCGICHARVCEHTMEADSKKIVDSINAAYHQDSFGKVALVDPDPNSTPNWAVYDGDELGPEIEYASAAEIRITSRPTFCLDCGHVPVSIPRLGIHHSCLPCDPWEALARMASTIEKMVNPGIE